MPTLQEQYEREAPSTFRLDVQLHDLLTKAPAPRPQLLPNTGEDKFPEPAFPQHPDLLAQDDNYEVKNFVMGYLNPKGFRVRIPGNY